MFNFLNKKNKVLLPIEDWVKDYIEDAFRWIIKEFGIGIIKSNGILLPEDFFFQAENPEHFATHALNIIAARMNVAPALIDLNFFYENISASSFILNQEATSQPMEESFTGLYKGKNEKGQYVIVLNMGNLKSSESFILTLAHELSHVKIAEINLLEYDEYLVELLSLAFGFGIFGANCSFIFTKYLDSWGYSKQGYFRPQDWAYSLAVYAFIRNEVNPPWSAYLSPVIKTDFNKSGKYLTVYPFKFNE